MRALVLALLMLFFVSCERSAVETVAAREPAAQQETNRVRREIRLTGIVEATRSSKVTVPQIVGQTGRLTLTRLIANGASVREGDVIAEFDPTQQLDLAFTARAKFEDLS